MMIEDKLNQEQRIRLEALGQAMNCSMGQTPSKVLETAKLFEAFIKDGTTTIQGRKH